MCKKICINRKLIFVDMGLGTSFANELKNVLFAVNNNIAHIDIHKNNLGDAGIITLMQAIKANRQVVSLNFASNEVTNEGMIAIFKGLKKNESVI